MKPIRVFVALVLIAVIWPLTWISFRGWRLIGLLWPYALPWPAGQAPRAPAIARDGVQQWWSHEPRMKQ